MAKKTKKQISDRVKELKRHDDLHYKGIPEIEDPEYDSLVEELRDWDPENPFLQEIYLEELKGEVVTHKVPMLSTQKVYKAKKLGAWIDRVLKAAKEVGVKNPTFRLTPKLDGIAGKDENNFLVTRGNKRQGNNITHIFNLGVTVYGGKRGQGAGEIVMVQSYFDAELSNNFKLPRNAVAGFVNSDNIDSNIEKALKAGKIHFRPFSTLPAWEGNGADLLANIGSITEDLRNKVDYPLDGMVAEVKDQKVKDHLGATNSYNCWQMAIKQSGETADTVVLDIGWQTGKTGKITPVLRIKPVVLDGAELRNVTAHHAGLIKEKKIGKGSEIRVTRAGGVIPKLVEVLTTVKKVVIPSKCPRCNGVTSWDNDFIKCTNTACTAQSETGILYFFHTIETAKGFGPKVVKTVLENGRGNVSEIFVLKQKDFESFGFGEKTSINLEKALKTAIETEIEDARFLAAFAIQKLGLGKARAILEKFKWSELSKLTADKLESLDGFASKTATSIVMELQTKWAEIEAVYTLGFKLTASYVDTSKEASKTQKSPIAGKKLCFTGKMQSGSRSKMEKQARSLGAKVSGFSNSLDYLIAGEDRGGKYQQAENAGITILTEEEYNKLLNI